MTRLFIKKSILVVFLFILLLFVFPIGLFQGDTSDIFTFSSVLFGLLVGFFIAATLTNYFRLQTLVSEQTTALISLYQRCKNLNSKIKNEVTEAIDQYLIALFDFEFTDYVDKTSSEFDKLIAVCSHIEFGDSQLEASFYDFEQRLMGTTQEISLTARRLMEKSHWITLVLLAIANIFLLYSVRNDNWISAVLTVLLSSATVIVLFLLYAIDNNTFAEEKLAFAVFQQVFREIGQLPYYLENDVKQGRIILPKGKCRLGVYKNYPISYRKDIKIIEVK